MTKLLLKIEDKLCDMSVFSRWPYNFYALKLQMKMHRIFRKTFSHKVQRIEYASSARDETLTFCMTDMRE